MRTTCLSLKVRIGESLIIGSTEIYFKNKDGSKGIALIIYSPEENKILRVKSEDNPRILNEKRRMDG